MILLLICKRLVLCIKNLKFTTSFFTKVYKNIKQALVYIVNIK